MGLLREVVGLLRVGGITDGGDGFIRKVGLLRGDEITERGGGFIERGGGSVRDSHTYEQMQAERERVCLRANIQDIYI